jgi:hypothetical protein
MRKIILPEGYGQLNFTKIGKHKVMVVSDWSTPFGVIPAGAESDGASIPRFLWWFTHPFAELLEASVVHDYHYENAIGSKEIADTAFKTVAQDYKQFNRTAGWKIAIAYFLVKKFGRGAY